MIYDIAGEQLDGVVNALQAAPNVARIDTAPPVLGRLEVVNGEPLRGSGDDRRRREARWFRESLRGLSGIVRSSRR